MDRKEKGAAKHLEIMPRSVLKSQEFLGDQTFSLTSKNRIPGSVTLDAFVTDAYISAYELAKCTFAFVLHHEGIMAGHTVIGAECGGGPGETRPLLRVDMLWIAIKPLVSQEDLYSATDDPQRLGGRGNLPSHNQGYNIEEATIPVENPAVLE